MTDREKAIVMAYTGVCMLNDDKFKIFHEYVEEIMGRPVYTHELADKMITDEIKEKAKDDFIALCAEQQQPCEDIGEISDGYHTFNQLYYQRAVLFATIVNQNKNNAWKSFKHSDGKYCFDSNGEWFIVGVDTPEGSYTYHYEKKYWDMFDCKELECGKEWDGHTEEDVTRLLSLQSKTGRWIMPVRDDGMSDPIYYQVRCSECGFDLDPQLWFLDLHKYDADKYCPKCGTKMIEPQERSVKKNEQTR